MANEWEIKRRSNTCTVTEHAFTDGETFHTLLFREKEGFRREDLCEDAFGERNDNIQPFSQWKSTYEIPPPPEPESVTKESAEDLLRKFIDEDSPEKGNARYILAIMLERKRTLKHVDTTQTESGEDILVYERAKTGEIFLIPDPHLHLDQIEHVQDEVALLLGMPQG